MSSVNRAAWNASSEDYQRDHGPQLNERPRAWGAFAVPELEVRALPDLVGKDVLEWARRWPAESLWVVRR